MEETILAPSPNWFLVSILGVSNDDWVVYGGPGKILIVLEPLSSEFKGVIDSKHRFKAHLVNRSHRERIVSVDISPDWPEKRHFISGSHDGVIKEWTLTQTDNMWTIKNIHSNEVHCDNKEDLISVGYSMGTHAISIGSFSNLVVWELNTNTTRKQKPFLKNFKPTCMSCSPHVPLVVAVGTKQGVVVVLDLKENGKILYKIRSQDDELCQVAWCPQYEVILKRDLNEKKSFVTRRMEAIRNVPQPVDLEASGTQINLPNDSFDESVIVKEDDMFDIYKDHESDEFGHKKYEPENVMVKIKDDSKKDDFLAECERLKVQILKNKNEEDESIETLVEAMDNAHVDASSSNSAEEVKDVKGKAITGVATVGAGILNQDEQDASAHIHRHLLASIGKQGIVRIWSKSGKIVAICNSQMLKSKMTHNVLYKGPHHPSLSWYKADTLLIADGNTQILECNPLKMDSKNRLDYQTVHSTLHRRAVYCVTSNAPRVQTEKMLADPDCEDNWSVWSVGQDRTVVKYCMKTRTVLAKIATCGGFLYDVKQCPYDAGKVAVGVGDGAIRIWQTTTTDEDDTKLVPGEVSSHWHHVQGKILQSVWHPTKENLIAYSTAESRVGIIDISKSEKPARALQPGLSHGVYSIAWGEDMSLFAIGGCELVMYQANKPDAAPIPIHIEIEGQMWNPACVNYSSHGLMVGSDVGGVALFSGPGGQALAAKFVYKKMIHAMEWHPQLTSSSDDESKYKDLVALCSVDKVNTIVVLEYKNKDGGGKELADFQTLHGHTRNIYKLSWSPHRDGQLLSTSQDHTVRVWDVITGVCTSIFDGHKTTTLSAIWCPLPQLAGKVVSGGGDCCLRLWDVHDFPAEDYIDTGIIKPIKKKKGLMRNKRRTARNDSDEENEPEQDNVEQLTDVETARKAEANDVFPSHVVESHIKWRAAKKYLLPILSKETNKTNINNLRPMLLKYFENNKEIKNIMELVDAEGAENCGLNFLKLFGTINDLNEILDMECAHHLSMRMYEAWMMLMIFRGRIDSVIQYANEHDLLDPFLLSMAPCVSYKYWKDVMQLYVAQIDRMATKCQTEKLHESKHYGGVYYRKAAALLAVHDVKGAVDLLVDAKLFKEAYILCRCRHMDSVARETMILWGRDASFTGILMLGVFIHLAIGNVTDAANALRGTTDEKGMILAAELAKVAGLNVYADYMETRAKCVEKNKTAEDETEELLAELPTRMELLMKEKVQDELKTKNVLEVLDAEGKLNGASIPESEISQSKE